MDTFDSALARWMTTRETGVRELAKRSGYSPSYISELRSGVKHPSGLVAADLDTALDAQGELISAAASGQLQRRAFVQMASATAAGTLFEARPGGCGEGEHLAMAVMGEPARARCGGSQDISALTRLAERTRLLYQGCQYSALARALPDILAELEAGTRTLEGDSLRAARILLADVYHVAAGLLLKLGEPALASVAADRSMHAANASEDPVAVGSSARIIIHTLMSNGHPDAAVTIAGAQAERVGRAATTPEAIAVYGALLLRGAIAAAHREQRDTALTMMTEASKAARRLGSDSNLRWTAFGPVNTVIHQVSIAVALGDAGTAIDIARGVNLSTVKVTERKACLLTDVAQAYLQWGKHERALSALRAAAEAATEEVTGRPVVQRLVRDLAAGAPGTVRRDARLFARHIGIPLT
jgi:hypothetical protein